MIFHTQTLILALKGKLCMIIHTQNSVSPTIKRVIPNPDFVLCRYIRNLLGCLNPNICFPWFTAFFCVCGGEFRIFNAIYTVNLQKFIICKSDERKIRVQVPSTTQKGHIPNGICLSLESIIIWRRFTSPTRFPSPGLTASFHLRCLPGHYA